MSIRVLKVQPEVIVESDYGGFFEKFVRDLMKKKKVGEFKHKRIIISAGPYRSYAVSYEIKDDTIHLDFYSALRSGFGGITDVEVAELIKLL